MPEAQPEGLRILQPLVYPAQVHFHHLADAVDLRGLRRSRLDVDLGHYPRLHLQGSLQAGQQRSEQLFILAGCQGKRTPQMSLEALRQRLGDFPRLGGQRCRLIHPPGCIAYQQIHAACRFGRDGQAQVFAGQLEGIKRFARQAALGRVNANCASAEDQAEGNDDSEEDLCHAWTLLGEDW
jgi:hypothetical protein